MESSTHQPSENRLVQKPGSDELAHDSDALDANIPIATPQAAPPLSRRTAGLRSRSAVMQMQRRVGNAFVQRQLAGNHRVTPNASADASVQREGEDPAVAAGPTSIGDGGTSVSAAGGIVKADGATVQLNAGMVTAPGVVQADTIIANSVIASSYSPGAGNVW